jgi:hypothetical protein
VIGYTWGTDWVHLGYTAVPGSFFDGGSDPESTSVPVASPQCTQCTRSPLPSVPRCTRSGWMPTDGAEPLQTRLYCEVPRLARFFATRRTGADGKERGRRDRWCPGAELNHRHLHFQCSALPTELPGRRACRAAGGKESAGVIKARFRAVQNGQEQPRMAAPGPFRARQRALKPPRPGGWFRPRLHPLSPAPRRRR